MERGELERAVMNELWRRPDGAMARDLAGALPSQPAHTTVLTILDRLARKGLVSREREGRAHRYRAVEEKDVHVAQLMQEAFSGAGDRESALSHFLESVDADDIAALRRALDALGGRDGASGAAG